MAWQQWRRFAQAGEVADRGRLAGRCTACRRDGGYRAAIDRRLGGTFGRAPAEIGLRAPSNEAPVVAADPAVAKQRQHRLESCCRPVDTAIRCRARAGRYSPQVFNFASMPGRGHRIRETKRCRTAPSSAAIMGRSKCVHAPTVSGCEGFISRAQMKAASISGWLLRPCPNCPARYTGPRPPRAGRWQTRRRSLSRNVRAAARRFGR